MLASRWPWPHPRERSAPNGRMGPIWIPTKREGKPMTEPFPPPLLPAEEKPRQQPIGRRWRRALRGYPAQFWLMFWGMLLATLGASMIWPYLLIYASQRLQAPLAQVGSLFTINAVMGLLAALLAGPVVDTWGRKGVLVVSLFGAGAVYFALGWATRWWQFALLMAFWGLFSPLYRVGGDAMLADLVAPARRPEAYALLRMANNLGVAVGPAVGGFLAATSYHLAFYAAAGGFAFYAWLLLFAARETLPGRRALSWRAVRQAALEYLHVAADDALRGMLLAYLLAVMAAALMWIFLSLYLKTRFGILESQFGWLATTNATLVVLFQFAVTRRAEALGSLRVMAAGAALYGLGVGSMALGRTFGHFWLSMVVFTVGEMLLVPTASAYVANLAPPQRRGRYMAALGLVWNLASGLVTPLGGWLSDHLTPIAPWVAALVLGLTSAGLFLYQEGRARRQKPAAP